MSILAKYYLLIKSLAPEFKFLRIEAKKEKWYWRLVDYVLFVFSFGAMDFMSFPSTIGNTFCLPDDWERRSLREHFETLLRHREWWRLYAKIGFGNLWLGCGVFVLVMVLCPPAALWLRHRVDSAGWRHVFSYKGKRQISHIREEFVAAVTGPSYFYLRLFPATIDEWFDRLMRESEELYETDSY
jgi:hypothetical protein